MKYKIFNPLTGFNSKLLSSSEAASAYQLIANEIKEICRVDRTQEKKLFTQLQIADNYFCDHFQQQTTANADEFAKKINDGQMHTRYDSSNLILETGEVHRYFSFHGVMEEKKSWWVKLKNNDLTDFYIAHPYWEQFNPITKQSEFYYDYEDRNGVRVEHKCLENGTSVSETYFQGYEGLPDNFKNLLSKYPESVRNSVFGWTVKDYGSVVAFREDLASLPNDASIDERLLVEFNQNFIDTYTEQIVINKVQVNEQGDEEWSVGNVDEIMQN